jgi:uncharacterized repeat protein (TIGR02543 family)
MVSWQDINDDPDVYSNALALKMDEPLYTAIYTKYASSLDANNNGIIELTETATFVGIGANGWLALTNSSITGTIRGIEYFTGISYLALNGNQLSGAIPADLGNMVSLKELQLYNNKFDGYIPATIGEMDSLEELWLNGNGFTGSIPAELFSMSSLRELYLNTNKLSGFIGSFPEENESKLEILNLYSNQLSGPIPDYLCYLTNLKELRLDNNHLTSIPEDLGNLTKLRLIQLNNNELKGELPDLSNIDGPFSIRMEFNPELIGIENKPSNIKDLTEYKTATNQEYDRNRDSSNTNYASYASDNNAPQNGEAMVLNQDLDNDGHADLNLTVAGGTPIANRPVYNIDVNGDNVADLNILVYPLTVGRETGRIDGTQMGLAFNRATAATSTDGNNVFLGWIPSDKSVASGMGKDDFKVDENYPHYLIPITNGALVEATNATPPNILEFNKEYGENGEYTLNIDTNGDGIPDTNIQLPNPDGSPGPILNIDVDNDGTPDCNIGIGGKDNPVQSEDPEGLNYDGNDDGFPDLNVDIDGDGEADLNIDTDGDGAADLNIDTDGDGIADLNIDTDGDGTADLNIDTNGDGVADENIDNVDENGDSGRDSKPDENIRLTVTAGSNGNVNPEGKILHDAEDSVSITATPDSNYVFSGWTVTKGGDDLTLTSTELSSATLAFNMPHAEVAIEANFEAAPPSENASLSGITVSKGELSPAFDPETTDYTVTVPDGTTSIVVTPTKGDEGATVEIVGPETLEIGENVFTVTVTAADGTTTQTYTVTVTREEPVSENASLSELTVSPGTLSPSFDAGITAYTVNVTNSTTSVTIAATASDENATVTGDGAKNNLAVGTNVFTIRVTAEDETVQEYTVTVTRAAPSVTPPVTPVTPVNPPATTYTVTFKDYNGSTLKTQTVASGAKATAPANPTRTGYTFTGWDNAFTNVTGNLTVTAQYSINKYTVTFVSYNGGVMKTQSVNYGANATAPASPKRSGYTFTGWNKNYTNVKANMTVTAKYEKNASSSGTNGSTSGGSNTGSTSGTSAGTSPGGTTIIIREVSAGTTNGTDTGSSSAANTGTEGTATGAPDATDNTAIDDGDTPLTGDSLSDETEPSTDTAVKSLDGDKTPLDSGTGAVDNDNTFKIVPILLIIIVILLAAILTALWFYLRRRRREEEYRD